MDFNYILVFKTPYLSLKKFINFYDISNYIVAHNIYEYTIFERMDGLKEVELIASDNIIKDLRHEIDRLNKESEDKKKFYSGLIKEKDKKIKELENELKVSDK